MFPAMLPPPTPFKLFALGAAVAEMSISHFLLAIFLGRTLRFLVLGILVVEFGPSSGREWCTLSESSSVIIFIGC